jgi:hypothetical protein
MLETNFIRLFVPYSWTALLTTRLQNGLCMAALTLRPRPHPAPEYWRRQSTGEPFPAQAGEGDKPTTCASFETRNLCFS